jgi:hypothetical protein
MLEFTYTNRGPAPWNIRRSNLIRLRWGNGVLAYDRYYDGDTTTKPITHVFENRPSPTRVALSIHWGCCGWSAAMHQVIQLIQQVKGFVEQGPDGTS